MGDDDASKNLFMMHFSIADDFVLPDFVEHIDDFDPFSDLISGDPQTIYSNDLDSGFVVDGNTVNFGQGDQHHIFGYDDPNPLLMDGVLLMSQLGEDAKNNNGGEDIDDDDDDGDNHSSSAMTTTSTNTTTSTPTKKKTTKVDRSRTLISERRRRGRMKENLYALRSLVPNITKMDKASIVGDALLYVQDLQIQAKKLRAEIVGLEVSLAAAAKRSSHHQQDQEVEVVVDNQNRSKIRSHGHVPNPKHGPPKHGPIIISRKILQMDVFQVEEREFYVRLVCSRGVGVAVSLYKALESLTTFNVETSNLASSSPDRFVLTFNLTIKEGEVQDMKLWITGALLNQGFEFAKTTPN